MGRNVVRPQSLLSRKTKQRCSGYLVYTDGWLWFGHVYVILRTSNSWVKINQNFAHTQVDVIPLGWLKDIEGEMVPFVIDIPYDQKRYGFGFFSCVELTKSVLGIKAWSVMTPKQLKRYMQCQKVCTQTYTRSARESQKAAVRKCASLDHPVHRLLKRFVNQLRRLRKSHR